MKLRGSGTGRTGGGFSGGGGAVSPLPAVRGTTRAQRQADLDQLTANSVAWHFADDAQKRALFEANNAIRQKYNLAYLPGTGETYNNAGVNLSAPVAEEVRTQQSYKMCIRDRDKVFRRYRNIAYQENLSVKELYGQKAGRGQKADSKTSSHSDADLLPSGG